jgi:hypothetical protein
MNSMGTIAAPPVAAASAGDCCGACANATAFKCVAFTFVESTGKCFLKNSTGAPVADPGATSGTPPSPCSATAGVNVEGAIIGPPTQAADPGACCAACRAFKPPSGGKACNTWVYCGNPNGCASSPHRACWLKWQPKPSAPAVTRGKEVAWTSGALFAKPLYNGEPGQHKKFHVGVTANAAKYVAWQVRVMHYWYKKRLATCTELFVVCTFGNGSLAMVT